VRNICTDRLGLGFDAWQDGAARLILAKRVDGKLACTIGGVGMSLPRQVGKTYLISAIVFGLCIHRPGTLVIWSAQHGKTHAETFLGMQEFCRRAKVKPYIENVYVGSGDEEVRFKNGSRILFGARENGFGRGIPGVDVIVSDEAQIMSDKALDAQLATMNTSDFGLAIYVGTPPLAEERHKAEAFTRMRTDAWSGEMRDAVWIELGADAGFEPTLMPAPLKAADWEQVAKANPSYPHRTPSESIERLRRKLRPESFMREGLGVWDEDTLNTVVDMDHFADLTKLAPAGEPVAYGLDMNPEQTVASVSVALRWPDGSVHVEEAKRFDLMRLGAESVVDWLAERAGRRVPVVFDAFSPARILKPRLQLKKARLYVLQRNELLEACGGFVQAVADERLTHAGDEFLTTALMAAEKEPVGKQGGWKWKLADSLVDNTPLMSATCAHYGAVKTKPRRATTGMSGGLVL
jgi:hypothetical protein